MSSPESRVDSRQELISTLAPQVCCPPDGTPCEESDFCRTLEDNPSAFVYQNDREFCDSFSSSGCRDLAREIKEFTATDPSCKLLNHAQLDTILRGISVSENDSPDGLQFNSRERQCRQAIINYRQEISFRTTDNCDGMSVADLEGADAYCSGNRQLTAPPPDGPSWLDDIADFIRRNGASFIAVIGAITVFLTAFKIAAKRLGTSVVELAKTMASWQNITGLFTRSELDVQRNTVASQFRGLSQKKGYEAHGNLFNGLEPAVRQYVAKAAIDRWNTLWTLKQNLIIGRRGSSSPGGLPYGFIEVFAKETLVPHKREALRTATANWIERERPEIETEDEANGRLRQTKPDLRIVVPAVDPIRGKPVSDVVLKQLEGLAGDPIYKDAGTLYAAQKGYVRLYLAELAINRWHLLPTEERGNYIRDDTLPLRGALPSEYIKRFASKYMKEKILEQVRTSSAQWAKDVARQLASEISPRIENIKNQVLIMAWDKFGKSPDTAQQVAILAFESWGKLDAYRKARFIDVTNPPRGGDLPEEFIRSLEKNINVRELQTRLSKLIRPQVSAITDQFLKYSNVNIPLSKYLARVLMDQWLKLDETMRANFVEPNRPLHPGQLPWMFIRRFMSVTDLGRMRKLADVYELLVNANPEFEHTSFAIDRVAALYEAWQSLPENIKKAFDKNYSMFIIPRAFVELMRTSLRIGTGPRQPLERADAPWRHDPRREPIRYDNFNLSLVMKYLVQENSDLALYPTVLKFRAKALVHDYVNLPNKIKEEFIAYDRENGNGNGETEISVFYMKVWHRLNGGIGIRDREPVPEDDSGNSGGTGGDAGGAAGEGTIGGYTPSDESGGSQTGMERGMLQYNGAPMTVPQTGAPSTAVAVPQNALFAMQSSLLMFGNMMGMDLAHAGARL